MLRASGLFEPVEMDFESDILIFPGAAELAEFAVQRWKKLSREAVGEGRDFSVALSGGKTPILFYRRLADRSESLPWVKTHIFWVDERFVPPESELGNYRLIKENLLERVPLPPQNVHPVATGVDHPRTAAIKYEESLRSHFLLKRGEFPRFGLIVLGIGEDGHTASLFPGSSTLGESRRLAVEDNSPPVPPPRVSLTLPVLNRAAHLLFLVTGKKKAPVLRRLMEGDSSLPASRVKPLVGELTFALDAAASSLLPGRKIKLRQA